MLTSLRQALDTAADQLPTDASRLFHGRGHCYPDLDFINIDWFAPVVRATIYDAPGADLMAAIEGDLLTLANQHEAIRCVSVQHRQRGQVSHRVIYGALPEQCLASEDGARLLLDLDSNQNIGFFLDARPGRQWLRREAAGKRVLNLFAYTCAFSIAALQAGARHVVNIDMARTAIATGQRNHALSNVPISSATFLPHDVFRSTRKLEKLGPYDVVVIDPPSRQKGSFEAEKDYARLVQDLEPMLAPGAKILACLNAPYLDANFLPELFHQQLPDYRYVERLAARADFPDAQPQRALKMQVFQQF